MDKLSSPKCSQKNLVNLSKQTVVRRALKCLKKHCKASRLDQSKIDDMTDAIGCLREAYDVESNYENSELNEEMIGELFREYPDIRTSSVTIVSETVEQGDKALSQQKYSDAVKCYTKALISNCVDTRVYIKRGKAFSELEQYQDAITDCEIALSLEPTYFDAYKILGYVYCQLEHLAATVRKYEAALKAHPKNLRFKRKWIQAKRRLCLVLANDPEEC